MEPSSSLLFRIGGISWDTQKLIPLQLFDNIKIPTAHHEFSVDFVNPNFIPCEEHFPNAAA